jgi:hypothetical protein
VPGFPFLVGAALVVVAILVNATIDPEPVLDARTGLNELEKGNEPRLSPKLSPVPEPRDPSE